VQISHFIFIISPEKLFCGEFLSVILIVARIV